MSVDLEGIGHRFSDGPWLFRGLTLSLRQGDLVALTGPSGSGKSTLLGIIAGWIKPTEGRVSRDESCKTNWVFQNPLGVPRRTAADHVALPLLARGYSPREADITARELLSEFMIAEVATRPFAALSGGEAQRLMLARSIASAPDLLLIDEPTAQLDQSTAQEVISSLANLAGHALTSVIATHDRQVRNACSRVLDLGIGWDTP